MCTSVASIYNYYVRIIINQKKKARQDKTRQLGIGMRNKLKRMKISSRGNTCVSEEKE